MSDPNDNKEWTVEFLVFFASEGECGPADAVAHARSLIENGEGQAYATADDGEPTVAVDEDGLVRPLMEEEIDEEWAAEMESLAEAEDDTDEADEAEEGEAEE